MHNLYIYVRLYELQYANDISCRGIGYIDLPNLDKVNSSLEIRDSYIYTIELPELANAGGLTFKNDEKLTYIGAPDLKIIGDQSFNILDNSKLAGPDNFSALENVSGIELSSDFTK